MTLITTIYFNVLNSKKNTRFYHRRNTTTPHGKNEIINLASTIYGENKKKLFDNYITWADDLVEREREILQITNSCTMDTECISTFETYGCKFAFEKTVER